MMGVRHARHGVSPETSDLDAPTFLHLNEASGKDKREREGKKAKQ